MLTIDEIKIETEENGFVLSIWTEDATERDPMTYEHRFRIGLPDQFLAEAHRTIGAWLAEGERAAMQHKLDQGYQPDSRHADYAELDDAPWPGQTSIDDLDLARDLERGK